LPIFWRRECFYDVSDGGCYLLSEIEPGLEMLKILSLLQTMNNLTSYTRPFSITFRTTIISQLTNNMVQGNL